MPEIEGGGVMAILECETECYLDREPDVCQQARRRDDVWRSWGRCDSHWAALEVTIEELTAQNERLLTRIDQAADGFDDKDIEEFVAAIKTMRGRHSNLDEVAAMLLLTATQAGNTIKRLQKELEAKASGKEE